MFNLFNRFVSKTFTPTYNVERLANGRFGIVANDGTVFKTYARKNDAFRGAERAGINVEGTRD